MFGSDKPLGFQAGDANLYRYVNNSPTNATDPSGLVGTQREAHGIVNAVLNNQRPWSDLSQLTQQQLDFEIQVYLRAAANPRGTLPPGLVREFNNTRVQFLRTGVGQGPGSVYQFAEGWLERQTPAWIEANAVQVGELRSGIQGSRQLAAARQAAVLTPQAGTSWLSRSVRIGGRVLTGAGIAAAIGLNIRSSISSAMCAVPPPMQPADREAWYRLINSFPQGDFRTNLTSFANLRLWDVLAQANGEYGFLDRFGAEAEAYRIALVTNVANHFIQNLDDLVRLSLAWGQLDQQQREGVISHLASGDGLPGYVPSLEEVATPPAVPVQQEPGFWQQVGNGISWAWNNLWPSRHEPRSGVPIGR